MKTGAPRLVSALEAAEALSIDKSRILALLRQGRVRGAYQVGGRWLIPVGRDGRPKVTEVEGPGPKATWATKKRR